jgi:hypothetical protein
MRTIMGVFAESPFKPLEEHILRVMECSNLLKECVKAFVKEDFERSEELALRISQVEHEADKIKNYIREHLPRSIFMPVNRGDFLNYLREQDHVADRIEDVALLMSLRRTKLPDELKADLLDLTKKVCDVVDIVPLALKGMNELLEMSFIRRKECRCMEYINLLNEKEQLTDDLHLKISKHLFGIEDQLTHGEFFHLMRTIKVLARVADHAENCGDRMRVMVAKQ